MRWCGITNRKDWNYDVKQLGWNYYMNEFSAAIGMIQLKKLDRLNIKRMKTAIRYHNEIKIERKINSFLVIFRSFTKENKLLSQNKKRLFEKQKKKK